MSHAVVSVELRNIQPTSADHADQDSEPTLPAPTSQVELRPSQALIVIMQLTSVTFLTSMSTGLMTVSVPRIASDLNIKPQLYYW